MTPQERQMIESLFERLARNAPAAGPRDPEAEALIQQRMQTLPGAAYYMAQTLVVQERALQEAEARLAGQSGPGEGSFLPRRAAPAYGQPYAGQPYGGQPQQPARGGVGSFLAGAGQMALGIGGGILVAEAATSLAQGLFGPHDAFAADEGQQAYDQAQDDSGGGYDEGDSGSAFDDGGDADSGDW